jgi:hypothetical protein
VVSRWLLKTVFDLNFSYAVSKRLFGFRLIRIIVFLFLSFFPIERQQAQLAREAAPH